MKIKLSRPLFLLTLIIVMACSLGSVSAANEIHDIKIDDTNTVIEHPEAYIQDSNIYNILKNTNHATIREAVDGSYGIGTIITNSNINNAITNLEGNFQIYQGRYGGFHSYDAIISSNLNNAITNYNGDSEIYQGYDGTVQDSTINNAITDFSGTSWIWQGRRGIVQDSTVNNAITNSDGKIFIYQGYEMSTVQDSLLNNAITNFSGYSSIDQGFLSTIVQDSTVNNAITNFDGTNIIYQGTIEDSKINNMITDFKGKSHIYQNNVFNSMLNNVLISSTDYSNPDTPYIPRIAQIDVDNSCLTNLMYKSENNNNIRNKQYNISDSQICNSTLFSNDTSIFQGINANDDREPIADCKLNSLVLFSNNTSITQTNLTGVNGCLIAIGCTNYTKTIDNLTDTNFFNLVISNHVIFDLHWS